MLKGFRLVWTTMSFPRRVLMRIMAAFESAPGQDHAAKQCLGARGDEARRSSDARRFGGRGRDSDCELKSGWGVWPRRSRRSAMTPEEMPDTLDHLLGASWYSEVSERVWSRMGPRRCKC